VVGAAPRGSAASLMQKRTRLLLRRVAALLTQHIEEITRGWVVDLRRTSDTEVHNELLSSQIVDGMKVILANLATTIATGVAPDPQSARAATIAKINSHRDGYPRAHVSDGAVPAPEMIPAPVEPTAPEEIRGRQPPPLNRVLYRALGADAAPDPDPAHPGEAARRALAAAVHKGHLRHDQGYQINEVVQEYSHLRRRLWLTLLPHMRRTDRPGVALTTYVDGILDDLLIATVQAYQDAAVYDLQKRAVRDPLTGLYNHDYCWERIHEEVRRAQRQGAQVTILMFDVDRLKEINDTFGHQMGDRVLIHVSDAMREVARQSDVLCRYAGDEFIIILPGSGGAHGAQVAERLRAVLSRPLQVSGAVAMPPSPPSVQVPVTISAGVATYPDDARMAETLTAQADAALYRAKAAGRDRVM
jgi:diguanylate cyclase (GGDEF)-like protein